MSSYSLTSLLSCVVMAVMLMDNGAIAQWQNTYYYRNSMPVNRYRPMQSNSIASRSSSSNTQQYKPNNPWAAYNNIHSNVPRSNSNNNNNNWGWPTATVRPQQQRWKLDFDDDSIEDHSIETNFYRRPTAVPRTQRHSIMSNNNNPHTSNNNNVNRPAAWSRPVTARPVVQQPQIRWNNNHFDDSVEDHSVESREFRRW